MQQSDFEKFKDSWSTAHEISSSNQLPSSAAINKSFEMLIEFPIRHVAQALDIHGKRSRFAPTPNDVLAILQTKDKRLTADEAWSTCPKSEFETVVWTDEMAEAYSICFDMLQDGDKIGARMAFKGAYERLSNISDLQNKPVAWRVAIGFDKQMIEPVVKRAVEAGRLTQDQAVKYLPAPIEAGPIAGMLTGKVVDISNGLPLKNAQRMKNIIANAKKLAKQKQDQKEAEVKKSVQGREVRRLEASDVYDKEMADKNKIAQ